MAAGSNLEQALVSRFLDLYLEDQARGCVQSDDAYLNLFPQARGAVARELRTLRARAQGNGAQRGSTVHASSTEVGKDILTRLAADRANGIEPTLSAYLALFPGRELEVATALGQVRVDATLGKKGETPEALGPFRIERELGRGGQATVYLGHDTKLDRPVALKVFVTSALLPSASVRSRFEREALTAARLDHPNLCAVYEFAEEGSLAYIAMRYVPGEPLSKRLARAAAAAGPGELPDLFSVSEASDADTAETEESGARARSGLDGTLKMMEELANAVHVAHEAGILHRDIKPANVMLTADGQPVLLDFGLAQAQEDEAFPSLTRTGDVLGTPRYMSPEQVRADGTPLDRRTDVYSLGVTLYECLTGRCPFEATGVQGLYRQILTRDAPRADRVSSGVPGDLAIVLETALEKDPDRRYPTARDLAEDLRRVREHEPILARSASVMYQATKFARRHRGLVVGAIGMVVASLIGTVVAVFFALRAQAAAELASEHEAEALQVSYRALYGAVERALAGEDQTSAIASMSQLPTALRGWETHHLEAHLNESLRELATGVDPRRAPAIGFLDGEKPVSVVERDGEGVLVDLLSDAEVYRLGPVALGYWLNEDPSLLIAESPTEVRVHDLASGRVIDTYPVPEEMEVLFARVVGDTLVLFGRGLMAFDVSSGELLYEREYATSVEGAERVLLEVSGLGFWCGERDALVLISSDPMRRSFWLELIALRSGERIRERSIDDLYNVYAMRESPDGESLTLVSGAGLHSYSLPLLEPLQSVRKYTMGVAMKTQFRGGITYGLGGSVLLVARSVSEVYGLDAASGSLRFTLESSFPATEAKLSESGKFVLFARADETGQRVELQRISDLPRRVLHQHPTFVYAVAFSPDGTFLATGDFAGVVRLFDAVDGTLLAELPLAEKIPGGLWFSSDGEWLVGHAVDSADPVLEAWNLYTGSRREFEDLLDPDCPRPAWGSVLDIGVTFIEPGIPSASSWDGRLRSEGGLDLEAEEGFLFVSDAVTGEERWRRAMSEGIRSVAFSPDGEWIAAGGVESGTVYVFSCSEGEEVAVISAVPSREAVFSVAFHPDGSRLATAGRDGVVRLWDTGSFRLAAELEGHSAYVHSVGFSPDGTMMATGSGDTTLRIWDTVPTQRREDAAKASARRRDGLRPLVEQSFHRLGVEAGPRILDDTLSRQDRAALKRLIVEQVFSD